MRARQIRLRTRPFAVALVVLAMGWLGAAQARAHPAIEEVEAAVEKAVAAHPEDADVHLRRAQVATRKGDWEAALTAHARARALGADPAEVSVLEGTIYLQMESPDSPELARQHFDEAMARGDRADARLGRARAWMQLGQPAKAEADYAVAFALLPKPRPSDVLRRRDALLAAARPAEALRVLDEGIARLGLVPSLQLAAIDLNRSAGDFEAALQRLDELIAASAPRPSPSWLAKRGEILEQAGRLPEADLAYAAALEDVQRRSARRGSRRLEAMQGSLHAALARVQVAEPVIDPATEQAIELVTEEKTP